MKMVGFRVMTHNSNITRRVISVVFLMMTLIGVRGNVLACGDKFLVVSRGTRFERPATSRSASILIYAKPGTGMATSLVNAPVEGALRKAGYLPTAVTSAQALDRQLQIGEWALLQGGAVQDGGHEDGSPEIGGRPAALGSAAGDSEPHPSEMCGGTPSG